ncbi:MAG: serine hydrolase domain-containing protein [Ilumatobacteraceae bacterium]
MIHGYAHERFGRVADTFASQIDKTDGGASVALFHHGELVVDLWGGKRTADDPWERDTLAMCFSTTKGVTATAVHVLADRGLIDYDAPVAAYWPEFARNGKEAITVRHVLSHSAGLHRFGTIVDHGSRMLDWEHMTAALAAARPAYPPGTTAGYHALTFGWLTGELVRRITGVSLNTFVQENIAEPLDLRGLFIGCPPDERGRVASLKPMLPKLPAPLRPLGSRALKPVSQLLSRAGAPINLRRVHSALLARGMEDVMLSRELLDAEVPAMNGHFDAVSLATMYAMLANGGAFGGVRILSEEAVERATAVQNDQRDHVVVVNMQWRLGYHRIPRACNRLPQIYGHLGFGGSGAWADPEHDLSLAMVCNRGGGTPIGDLRIMRLTSAATDCVLGGQRSAARRR